MKKKAANCLEEPIDILEVSDEEMTLLEPSENEILLLLEEEPMDKNNVLSFVIGDSPSTTRRASSNIDSRIDSALVGLIEQRMQTKALPLALRKRLMYQRAVSA